MKIFSEVINKEDIQGKLLSSIKNSIKKNLSYLLKKQKEDIDANLTILEQGSIVFNKFCSSGKAVPLNSLNKPSHKSEEVLALSEALNQIYSGISFHFGAKHYGSSSCHINVFYSRIRNDTRYYEHISGILGQYIVDFLNDTNIYNRIISDVMDIILEKVKEKYKHISNIYQEELEKLDIEDYLKQE